MRRCAIPDFALDGGGRGSESVPGQTSSAEVESNTDDDGFGRGERSRDSDNAALDRLKTQPDSVSGHPPSHPAEGSPDHSTFFLAPYQAAKRWLGVLAGLWGLEDSKS